jgi:hypothetical protein
MLINTLSMKDHFDWSGLVDTRVDDFRIGGRNESK